MQQAALELFRKRGYEHVTSAEIAERAGVTERTFFRYFVDKRETLFGGEAMLQQALIASITDAPPTLLPLAILLRSFHSVESLLENNRRFSVPRQTIIDATPALQERELAKHAAMARSLATALEARGVKPLSATLAAQAGMAAFVLATLSWLRNADQSLAEQLRRAESELKSLLAETRGRRNST